MQQIIRKTHSPYEFHRVSIRFEKLILEMETSDRIYIAASKLTYPDGLVEQNGEMALERA